MSDNFYIKSNFTDFDDMAKAFRQWHVEIRQLEKTKINDTMTQFNVNNIYMLYAKFTGRTQQVGQTPPGRTFSFHMGTNSQLHWRNKEVPLNALMIHPLDDNSVDVVTKGRVNNPHTISVPEDVLTSRLSNSEKKIYEQIVSTQDIVLVQKPEMANLKTIFDKYLQSLEEDPELIHHNNFQMCMEEEVLSALIEALFSIQNNDNENILAKHSTIWKILENFIEENKYRAIKVSELSKIAKISERSLYPVFDERFGITPKAYLNKIRLNGTRSDILNSSMSDTKILNIANNWGFWHMGQFAADYKNLFGELPSETLHSD